MQQQFHTSMSSLKRLLFFITCFTWALAVISCGGTEPKEPEPEAYLSVDKTTVSFTGQAGEQSLSVSSNSSWTAKVYSGSDWLSVSSGASGTGNGTVTLKASANESDQARTAGMMVSAAGHVINVAVSQDPKAKTIVTLKQVRALYTGSDVKIADEIYVQATVISNYIYEAEGGLNNATSLKTMVISDGEAGLQLYCDQNNATDDSFTSFKQGDLVEIGLQNQTLSVYSNGVLQVNGMSRSAITKIGTSEIKAVDITAAQLLSGAFESMYVAIPEVQVVDADLNKTFVVGGAHTSVGVIAKTKETFEIFTSRYASFGTHVVPSGNGTLKGIAGKYGDTYQISLAYVSDVDAMTGERFYADPTFGLSTLTQEVDGQAGSFSVSVATNVDWEAVSSQPQEFAVSPAQGEGDAQVTITYTQNPSNEQARTATITFTTTNEAITEKALVLTITQQPYEALVSDAVSPWMELPKVQEKDGYVFITHQGTVQGKSVRNYAFWYDTANLYAQWVAYPLYKTIIGSGSRTDNWDYNPKIPKRYQPELYRSYTGAYDRGHQLPSADRLYSAALNNSTFYFTNLAAQVNDLNGGVWMYLESAVRTWAKACDTLYVVTGALAQTADNQTITYTTDNLGKKVAIPHVFFKALLRYEKAQEGTNGGYRAIGFCFENRGYSYENPKASDAMSIDKLEELTGFDFFHNLPDDLETTLESTCLPVQWDLE